MIRHVYWLVIMLVDLQLSQGRILSGCRFANTFYRAHSSVFELDSNHRSLTVRPLYAFSNQSFFSMNQSFSVGIIYRFADTYLVPVPLLFECPTSERMYVAQDCEFTIMDTRVSHTRTHAVLTLDRSASRLVRSFGSYERTNAHVNRAAPVPSVPIVVVPYASRCVLQTIDRYSEEVPHVGQRNTPSTGYFSSAHRIRADR